MSLAPAARQVRVGGRSVLLIAARAAGIGPDALLADCRRILAIVAEAAGPVKVWR